MDIYENEDGLQPQPITEDPDIISETFSEDGKLQADSVGAETVDQPEETPAQEPVKKKKRRGCPWGVAIPVTAALVIAAAVGVFTLCSVRLAAQEKRTEQMLSQLRQQIVHLQEELNSKSFTGNGNSVSGSGNTTADGTLTVGQVYAKVVDSVVAITSQTVTMSGSSYVTSTSSGSGFIITEDGYVATNYHVVDGATTVTVTTNNGISYDARVIGYDSANDLAVLKVQALGLKAVTIGSSSDLIVGDQVVVVGNPLGELEATLTVGYISGKDRVISNDGSQINMLQTDAAVNSGNSGGPIFNMNGEVVGIITAKYSGTTPSGASIEGIGFAIPMDDVARKITDLVQYGYITGAYLGVSVQNVDQNVAEHYGLPLGAYVYSTAAGYCAEKAGLQAKDIITALGEYPITCINDLTRALQNFEAGDTTVITVWRSGLELELEITLDEKPHN